MKDNLNFVVAGAFSKFAHIAQFIMGNPDAPISVYDGIGTCPWNGGRINRRVVAEDYQIAFYEDRGIGINLTMSHPNIDISNPEGLAQLDMFHREGNGIILRDLEFLKFINTNYPLYRTIYSITGTGHLSIPMDDIAVDFYKSLESSVDLIVPRMEHIVEDRFIMELDQSKYEVMVNDTCIHSCEFFESHFNEIALCNTRGDTYEEAKCSEECWLEGFDPDVNSTNPCMDLWPDDILKFHARGINHFKFTGRELDDEEFMKVISSLGVTNEMAI